MSMKNELKVRLTEAGALSVTTINRSKALTLAFAQKVMSSLRQRYDVDSRDVFINGILVEHHRGKVTQLS